MAGLRSGNPEGFLNKWPDKDHPEGSLNVDSICKGKDPLDVSKKCRLVLDNGGNVLLQVENRFLLSFNTNGTITLFPIQGEELNDFIQTTKEGLIKLQD